VLVSVVRGGEDRRQCEEHLDELGQLAATAGLVPSARLVQERGRLDPATLIGRGKVEELRRLVHEHHAVRVLVDLELGPQQVANLEKAVGIPVTDRSGLILEIFGARARSHEARTQVELAALRYQLPRLTRRWTHLSRQAGGFGRRGGGGEMQIETDRRLVRRRIAHLERELERVKQRRQTRRQGRSGPFSVALVGYTNSGKSTLFNALTRAGTVVEDRLFATLDPLVRRLEPAGGRTVLVSDTVGFIRKLPHDLVASFRSTLEEAADADLLVHVVDASDPQWEEKMETTSRVLADLELAERPQVVVFNKMDRVGDPVLFGRLRSTHPAALFLSAADGIGVEALRDRLLRDSESDEIESHIDLDADDGERLQAVHRLARVIEVTDRDGRLRVRYRATRAVGARLTALLNGGHAAGVAAT